MIEQPGQTNAKKAIDYVLRRWFNSLASGAAVVANVVMVSGYVEDPAILKACGLAAAILAALGFQRAKK